MFSFRIGLRLRGGGTISLRPDLSLDEGRMTNTLFSGRIEKDSLAES